MREIANQIIAEVESLAAAKDVTHEQVDNLVYKIDELGDIGASALIDELRSGDLTYRKEGLMINILRRLRFWVRKEIYPDEGFGYWILDGDKWLHILPKNFFRDFYRTHDSELSEIMTVEEWVTAAEKLQQQRQLSGVAGTIEIIKKPVV